MNEIVKLHNDSRAKRLELILFMRNFKNNDSDRMFSNKTILKYAPAALPAPRPELLKEKAYSLLNYSQSSWVPHGNEYYSMCGMDDYEDMKRQHAKQLSKQYFAAWKELVKK